MTIRRVSEKWCACNLGGFRHRLCCFANSFQSDESIFGHSLGPDGPNFSNVSHQRLTLFYIDRMHARCLAMMTGERQRAYIQHILTYVKGGTGVQ